MKELVQQVIKGNPRAIAKVISLIENNGVDAQEVMKKIFPHTGKSIIVGITGSPGSGKSSIVDQMVSKLRDKGNKIGIVAVDPTSPFSGGAILGDNVKTGINALLMPGVKVGANSWVGANLIVKKDIPANTVALLKQDQELLKRS